MKEERLHEFTNLIDLGGGWAARALFDDAVSRKIDGLPQIKHWQTWSRPKPQVVQQAGI